MGELVNPISLELQLKPILQHLQILVQNQSLDDLQTFLNEVNLFLLNLKTVLDAAFITTTSRNRGENGSVLIEKPLTAIYSFKDKVILKPRDIDGLRHSDVIHQPLEIKEDLAYVKLETEIVSDDYKYEQVKLKNVIVKEDYKENDHHAFNEADETAQEQELLEENFDDDDDDADTKNGNNFYKNKGSKIGYQDSYPISQEEYNAVILKGSSFECPKCDKPCKRRYAFDYHLLGKCTGIKMIWPKWKKVKKDKFMCLIAGCPEKGNILGKNPHAWKHHYDVHAPQAKGAKSCEYCGKRFTFTGDLSVHIKTVHTKVLGKPFYQCKFCGKRVRGSHYLKVHERTHTGEKPFPCEICDYKGKSKLQLKNHMEKHDEGPKNEMCDHCGKSFKHKKDLKKHIVIHLPMEERKKFVCKVCGRVVKRASTLQLHEKLCASKTEEIKVTGCVHCDFASASPSEMLEHIYSNHRHILARKFCERCGKNFKATDSLKRHMKMHLDIREKCPLENCGMMIRDLQRHMFKAHKSNVHKCPDCPQELATALGVELHRHRVHGMPKPSKLRETVTMQHFKTENKDQ